MTTTKDAFDMTHAMSGEGQAHVQWQDFERIPASIIILYKVFGYKLLKIEQCENPIAVPILYECS